VVCEIGGQFWRSVPLEIGGRGRDDETRTPESARDEIDVLYLAEPHSDVDALLDQINVALVQRQVDDQLALLLLKLECERSDALLPQRDRGVHPQHAA
jgi:hypothetical protein